MFDEICQSHDVEGLYVLDAASNPTITLLANAYHLTEQVQDHQTTERGTR